MIRVMQIVRNIRTALSFAAVMLAMGILNSCDLTIHDFPDGKALYPVEIKLDFNVDSDIYKTITLDTKTARSGFQARHIIEAHSVGEDGIVDRKCVARYVFTTPEISDTSLVLWIPQGSYSFIVWSDWTKSGGNDDLYYSTADFSEISLKGDHCGSTDLRDAFRGESEGLVYAVRDGMTEIAIPMERPLARYEFIAEDLAAFMSKASDLSDYTIVFRYAGYMPSSYNMFTFKPADSSIGVSFSSSVSVISENEAMMGFDYVFVNGGETVVKVVMETYDKDGMLVSRSDAVDIPLTRNMTTVVKGDFLTRMAPGGVGIQPGYDGEFDILIK